MRYTRHFASIALAVGMLLAGASVVSAADWRDSYQGGRREFRGDYGRVERMRANIARDRARLEEDMRWRRWDRVRRDRADLARDERELDRYGRRW